MGLFTSFDICASGMTAQRFRTDVIAENIANVNTTRDANGNVTKHGIPVFQVYNKFSTVNGTPNFSNSSFCFLRQFVTVHLFMRLCAFSILASSKQS